MLMGLSLVEAKRLIKEREVSIAGTKSWRGVRKEGI